MNIIHLSDPHFGNPEPNIEWKRAFDALEQFIVSKCAPPRVLVLSGDIALKGNPAGYVEARERLSRLRDYIFPAPNFVVCPGNHDLNRRTIGSEFKEFDAFSSWLRNDKNLSFSRQAVHLLAIENCVFAVINSASHLDHEYGHIDEDALRGQLEANASLVRSSTHRFAITHHHLIGRFRTDTSTTRNAYPILELLDHHNFQFVLHGHQHAYQELTIGRSNIKLFGASSAAFHTRGYTNGFLHYSLVDGVWQASRYAFSGDGNIPEGNPYIVQLSNSH